MIKALLTCTLLINCAFPASAQVDRSGIFLDITTKELNSGLSEMETYYYGHDYEDQSVDERLEKLEKTVYHHRYQNIDTSIRFKEIYNKFKNKKSPFYNGKNTEPALSNSQMALLMLMERRLLGNEQSNISIDERLRNLEKSIFGTEFKGDIQKRFEQISENTPVSIKGVRVSQNGKTIASFKPDYKKIPLPESPHKETFTPLNIAYDDRAGDYYNDVVKNNNGEVLRWKDFPINVYIHSKDPIEDKTSRMAVEYWQNKVPINLTNDYQSANILIDWASKSNYITVPIATKTNQEKEIKVLINLGGIQETEEANTLPLFIIHQIGHALGIWGHSDDINDLMYPTGRIGCNDINIKRNKTLIYQPIMLQAKRANITTRDLNTLLRIYQTPTSITKLSNK